MKKIYFILIVGVARFANAQEPSTFTGDGLSANNFEIHSDTIMLVEGALPAPASGRRIKIRHEISSDRPGISDGPNLVKRGLKQVEMGVNHKLEEMGDVREEVVTYNSTLLRLGVLDNVELRLALEYNNYKRQYLNRSSSESITTFSPFSIGGKVFITDQAGIVPAISLVGQVTLPYTMYNEIQLPFIGSGFLILAQHTFSESVSLTYNLGSSWDGVNPNARGMYALCLDYSFKNKLGVFGELYGEISEISKPTNCFDGGFVYLIAPNLQVDISGGFDLLNYTRGTFYSLGFSWLLPK
jgi:hypothetical protein